MSEAKIRSLVFDSQLSKERSYWLGKLSSQLQPCSIIPDFRRLSGSVPERLPLEILLSAALCDRLAKLTNNSPFLLYTAFLAALKFCLYRHAGLATVATGSPVRRNEEETQSPPIYWSSWTRYARN